MTPGSFSTHSVPHLSTPALVTPPMSKCAQWDLLESYLENLPSSLQSAGAPSWLDKIDAHILFTLLAKQSSKLEFLRLEAEQRYVALLNDSSIKFPEYNVATPNPGNTPSPQATPVRISIPPGARQPFHRARNIDEGIRNALFKLNTSGPSVRREHVDNGLLLPGQISPLSPTFGPRRGIVPSGTVERRRASLSVDLYVPKDETPASTADKSGSLGSAVAATADADLPVIMPGSLGKKKRILWEAAWIEIERNLEQYVGRFGAVESDEGLSKEKVWRRLIELRNEIAEWS